MEIWKELGTVTEETGVRAFKEARRIDIELIRPNPLQPRKSLDKDALQELAESIREQGLLQPIVVRPEGEEFIIIAGHRRYEAGRLIGLERIPSVVREATEQEALEQSLIENVQREDINPVEEAQCYRQLMDEHTYSIRDMAAKVHKSVGYIHGRLQLLKHEDIAQSVSQAQVGVFEARELAKVEDVDSRRELTARVAAGELNRKALRREVKILTGELEPTPPGRVEQPEPPEPVLATYPEQPPRVEPPDGEEQLSVFDSQAFSQRWRQLHEDLEALDASRLTSGDLENIQQFLKEIRRAVEGLLARLWPADEQP
jgi:ParB family chromosome partitioning protein